MTDIYALRNRPLWQWVLRAIAPGLICDALGLLTIIAERAKLSNLSELMIFPLLLAPLIGLVYLIPLGRSYVKAGMSNSLVGFVIGYGILNVFLWGAGCAMVCSTMGPMH